MGIYRRTARYPVEKRLCPRLRFATRSSRAGTRGVEDIVAAQNLPVRFDDSVQMRCKNGNRKQPQTLSPFNRSSPPVALNALSLVKILRKVHLQAVAQLTGSLKSRSKRFGGVRVSRMGSDLGPNSAFLCVVELETN